MPSHESTKLEDLPQPAPLYEAKTILGSKVDGAASSMPLPESCYLPLVPGFKVEGELGRGGMGVVFLARQRQLNRLVALKMILSGKLACEKTRLRFLAEAEAIAKVQHPGIVQVYEFGMYDDNPYFALEYISGGSLDKKLRGTPLPPMHAASLIERLACAMHCAHKQGIIHRDLKPGNILLAENSTTTSQAHPKLSEDDCTPRTCPWQPKITDFGLVKQAGSEVTVTGHIMGTPSYMAPEQADCKKTIGPGADIYALGAVLYECLTGRPPFKASTDLDTILQVVNDEPVCVRQLQPRTPRGLELICMKCLQKNPAKRYASAQLLADDLGRFLAGEPVQAQPPLMLHRVTEWFRRHPWALINMSAMVIAFLVSIAYGFWTLTAEARWRQYVAEARVERLEGHPDRAWRFLHDAAQLYEDPRLYHEAMAISLRKLSDDASKLLPAEDVPSSGRLRQYRPEREDAARDPRWKGIIPVPREVAFTPDKQLAAITGDKLRTVEVVIAESLEPIRSLEATPGFPRHWYEQVHHGDILQVGGDVLFSQDGHWLAAQLDTPVTHAPMHALVVWDLTTGHEYLRIPNSMHTELIARPEGLAVVTGNQSILLSSLHDELQAHGALRWMHAVSENNQVPHLPVYIDLSMIFLKKWTGLPGWLIMFSFIILPWVLVFVLRWRFDRCRQQGKLPSRTLIACSLLAGMLALTSGFLYLFSYFNTLGWSFEALLTGSNLYLWFFSNLLAGTQLLVLTANAYRVAEFGDEWKDVSLLGFATKRA